METSESVVSTKVIDPLVTILTGYNLTGEDDEEYTSILEKLGEELNQAGFVPSLELVTQVEQFMNTLLEEEEDDVDDLDEDDLDDDPDLNV